MAARLRLHHHLHHLHHPRLRQLLQQQQQHLLHQRRIHVQIETQDQLLMVYILHTYLMQNVL